MHRKGVSCELHDSYFRLMTIKHAILKIEWAIEWALNYYITQSRQEVRLLEIRRVRRQDVVGNATPGRRGSWGPRLSWGPEKLLIRCGWESPAEGALGALMSWGSETAETRCGRESHTRPKLPSGPPMEFWRPVGDKMQ